MEKNILKDLTVLIILKNIIKNWKKELFTKVYNQASKLTNNFVIVNDNSEDETVNFLKSLDKNIKILNNDNNIFYDRLKKQSVNLIKTEYVLILDDDEVLTDNLIKEIKENYQKYDIYFLQLRTLFLWKYIDKIFQPRLFKINFKNIVFADNIEQVHQQYKINTRNYKEFNVKIYKTKYIIEHHSFLSIKYMFKKTFEYASNEAENMYKKKPNIWNFKLFFMYWKDVFYYLIIYLFYYKNIVSFRWILYSFNSAFYQTIKYIIYIEKQLKWKIKKY